MIPPLSFTKTGHKQTAGWAKAEIHRGFADEDGKASSAQQTGSPLTDAFHLESTSFSPYFKEAC